MNCAICNHEEHDAGQCKQCNCRQSEITYVSRWMGLGCGPYSERSLDDSLSQIYHTTATATIYGERHYHCQKYKEKKPCQKQY